MSTTTTENLHLQAFRADYNDCRTSVELTDIEIEAPQSSELFFKIGNVSLSTIQDELCGYANVEPAVMQGVNEDTVAPGFWLRTNGDPRDWYKAKPLARSMATLVQIEEL